MYRTITTLVAVITAAINWWIFRAIASYFGSSDPEFLATALIVSVAVHELGHMFVLERNGIRTSLVFLVIAGGAVPHPDDHEKLDKLTWGTSCWVDLAGVTGNMFFVGGAAVFYSWNLLSETQFLQIASLNGILVVINLLPFWKLDGGRFAKTFFNSVPEQHDRAYVVAIVTIVVLGMAAVAILMDTDVLVLQSILLFWGLQAKATNDDPRGSFDRRAMTTPMEVFWAGTYTTLYLGGVLLTILTPNWMM